MKPSNRNDTIEARRTAEYLRELLHYSPSNILSMAWYERIAAYSRGEVAMAAFYVLVSVIVSIAALFAGMALVRSLT